MRGGFPGTPMRLFFSSVPYKSAERGRRRRKTDKIPSRTKASLKIKKRIKNKKKKTKKNLRKFSRIAGEKSRVSEKSDKNRGKETANAN